MTSGLRNPYLDIQITLTFQENSSGIQPLEVKLCEIEYLLYSH